MDASESGRAASEDERAENSELAAAGGGASRRRRREEADTAGGAARKKPRSVCPHQHQRSQCKECGGAGLCTSTIARGIKTRGVWGGHQPTQVPEEQMQGVRGGQTSARTSAGGANARSQGGRASARTSDRDADAKECGGAQHLRSKCKECASTLVRRGEYRAQTGIWCLLGFVSARTIKGRSINAGSRSSARTSARGANARCAGGRASASTS